MNGKMIWPDMNNLFLQFYAMEHCKVEISMKDYQDSISVKSSGAGWEEDKYSEPWSFVNYDEQNNDILLTVYSYYSGSTNARATFVFYVGTDYENVQDSIVHWSALAAEVTEPSENCLFTRQFSDMHEIIIDYNGFVNKEHPKARMGFKVNEQEFWFNVSINMVLIDRVNTGT